MTGKRLRSGHSHADRPYSCSMSKNIIRNRSALLDTINGFYATALDRLPVDEMPALVPRLLKAGLCLGFSDPITNIIVNTISYSSRVPDHKSDAGKKKRRQKALSRAVADTGNVKYWPPYRPLLRDMPVATRSLEALVAFLTYSFRYLPVSEALEYLRLAKADLRAAVRLIEEDRNSGGSFSLASRTTKTALKCAALAAWHPKPRVLVNRSYSLASRMGEVSQLLATEGACLSCSAIETINRLLKRRRKIRGLTGFFVPSQFLHEQPPFVATKSLQSVLIDKIYGLYIDALAQLPQDLLRQRYHRGLLTAGHCYGPLKNPVFNIVLNAVWYETMFPRQAELSVVMICSRSLVRVACRSLRGLIAYIRASFNMMISEHHAMRYLLLAEVNLWGAIEMARQEGYTENTLSDQDSAYEAAATAAMHPDPDALVKFLVSTYPSMPVSLQTEPFVLDVQVLSKMVMQYSSTHGSVQTVPSALSEGGSKVLSWIQSDFKEEERFVLQKVNAALKKYSQQTEGPEYEVHVICGLNSKVGSSYVFGLHYGPGHMRPRKSQYSHINFLAIQGDLQSSDTFPILFFAECSNNEDVTDESSCWPVMGHTGRCFNCENEGAKIVHPDKMKYNGSDIDFERMACENLGGMTIDDSGHRLITDSIDVCEEDCIYFDAGRDVNCAKFLNARARIFKCGSLV